MAPVKEASERPNRKRSRSGSQGTFNRQKKTSKDETNSKVALRDVASSRTAQREKPIDSEYLAARKKARLAGLQVDSGCVPKNLVHEAMKSKDISKAYKACLRELCEDLPTGRQITRLNNASHTGPNYLGRTASLTNGLKFKTWSRGTNGHTTASILMPAADTNPGHALHASLFDLTQGELLYMTGRHLIWQDMHGDELLSYSIDPLFLVHHALNRHHQNQGGTTIQFLDRRRAKDVRGEPAAFYPALEVYEAFEVPNWEGWGQFIGGKLYPRKFTQEYLSHGTVLVRDDRFVQASIEDLIRDGLYELFPFFEVPDDCIRAGLYSGQVAMRTIGYPPGEVKSRKYRRIYAYEKCAKRTPFTTEVLELAQKLTRNFMGPGEKGDREGVEPHLHIFLCFLTFQKRRKRNKIFVEWIEAHYKASDVTDLYDDGNGGVQPHFARVANNLPGVMQYLDLVRDAAFAFNLPELPPNELECKNKLTSDLYAGQDSVRDKDNLLYREYDEAAQTDERDRKRTRRKQTNELLGMVLGGGVMQVTDGKEKAKEAKKIQEGGTAESEADEGSGAEEAAREDTPMREPLQSEVNAIERRED